MLPISELHFESSQFINFVVVQRNTNIFNEKSHTHVHTPNSYIVAPLDHLNQYLQHYPTVGIGQQNRS